MKFSKSSRIKRITLRRSTVLILSLQQGFPGRYFVPPRLSLFMWIPSSLCLFGCGSYKLQPWIVYGSGPGFRNIEIAAVWKWHSSSQ